MIYKRKLPVYRFFLTFPVVCNLFLRTLYPVVCKKKKIQIQNIQVNNTQATALDVNTRGGFVPAAWKDIKVGM